jgi:hypothetical protein
MTIRFLFPFFFRFEVFRDLRLSYLLGIGVETAQVQNILLDFLNLYLVSMYVFNNRNPILIKVVKKIFWRFPSKFEDKEKWNRLEPIVKQQVNWLYNPSPLTDDFDKTNQSYKNLKVSEKDKKIA